MNKKQILIVGSILAGLGVALGAVGAHALKEILMANGRTETFETAVRYQVYHGLALLFVGMLSAKNGRPMLKWVANLFLTGTVFFSGSLFALSLTSIKWVVFVTPVGGVLMIAGWGLLLFHFIKTKE
jgi:uncharacterized membrane protein YgdD (TMEM256/DUF423 family)